MEPSALIKEIHERIKNDPIFRFAKINSETHVVENLVIVPESSLQIENFLDRLALPGEKVYWLKCEKDQYMEIGETYSSTFKRCIMKQPHPCLILNADGYWVPPIPKPDDINHNYVWDNFLEEWIILDPSVSLVEPPEHAPPVDIPLAPFVGYSTTYSY